MQTNEGGDLIGRRPRRIEDPRSGRLPVGLASRREGIHDAPRRLAVPPFRHASGTPLHPQRLDSRNEIVGIRNDWFVPSVIVIGRSVLSRTVKHGTPSAVVSSWMPPESVTTACAPASRSSMSR